jgi:GNAT superfamily N-acetyltransferase
VDIPSHAAGEELATALEEVGGTRVTIVPAQPRELIDEPTRALTLVARLRSDPRALPEVLAELLRADMAAWVFGAAAEREEADALTVPVGPLRAVRLGRTGLPFTMTEAARAGALVRAVLPDISRGRTPRLVSLRDGTRILVRPIEERDTAALRDMHERCSPESRRLRYLGSNPALPQRTPETFCSPAHGLTLVAEGPDGSILALAHLMHLVDPGVAEPTFLVEDHWQGRGLGRALTELLVEMARERGLVELRATMLGENARMLALLTSFGGRVRDTRHRGVVEMTIRLDGKVPRGLSAAAGRGR